MTDHELLEQFAERVRALATALRAQVRATLGVEAIARIDERDRMFFYGRERSARGEICYLKPLKDSVNLGFMQGAELPDPHGLLGGTGKLLRHVKLRKPADLDHPGLMELVRAALAHHRATRG